MEAIKYLSAQEVSASWGISKRRVQNLCVNNRIPGAVRIGNMWAIPFDATKPKDARFHEHEKSTMPLGLQTRKARRELKTIVDSAMKALCELGLTGDESLHILIICFAAKLLNVYFDNIEACITECEHVFGYSLRTAIPTRISDNISLFISNNQNCLDDSLSWVYQFGSKKTEEFYYQDTQFFTEKYMISTLIDSINLDRTSRVIDPACGGGNFLLYSFETMMEIFEDETPIMEKVNHALKNLSGYEIDSFLANVATYNLKLKALSFAVKEIEVDMSLFRSFSPLIYFPRFESVPGFLDINWEDQLVVNCGNGMTMKLREAFDGANVVVTNPPFRTIKGMPNDQKEYLQTYYPLAKCDMCNAFIERVMDVLPENGIAAMVTQNSWMYLDSFTSLRRAFLSKYTMNDIWELGSNAFYDLSGEKANVALVVFKKSTPDPNHIVGLRNLRGMSIEQIEDALMLDKALRTEITQSDVLKSTESRFDMFSTTHLKSIQSSYQQYKDYAIPMQGTSTGNAKELIDYYWKHIGDPDWVLVSKGGGYSRYEGLNSYCVKWGEDGKYIKNTKGSAIRNANYFDQTQLVFSDTGTAGLNVRILMPGQIFVASGPGIRVKRGSALAQLAFLNSRFSSFFVRLVSPKLTIAAGYIGQIPVTEELMESATLEQCAVQCLSSKVRRLKKRPTNYEFLSFSHQGLSIETAAKTWFEEDLFDEWTQLVNEQIIEDEISREMHLTQEDFLAIDNYIGPKRVNIYEGELKLQIDLATVSGGLGYDCLPKRTKASKKSLGSDGMIEYISQCNDVSCEQAYHIALKHYECFADKYIDLYLHSLLLSAYGYRNVNLPPQTMTDVMRIAGIGSEEDKAFTKKWIDQRFNEVHRESFWGDPIIRYDSKDSTFSLIKE